MINVITAEFCGKRCVLTVFNGNPSNVLRINGLILMTTVCPYRFFCLKPLLFISAVGTSTSPIWAPNPYWVHGWLLSPTARGPYLHYALQGLELSSHHPVGLYSDTKRYNLKY